MPTVLPLVDGGLGNSTYLVDLGDGRGLAVDPSRDLRALGAAAGRAGLTVAYVAETHLHADFVSGARALAAAGAEVLAATADRREFPHRGLADGDEEDLGGLTLRAVATPGHTPGHLAYVLLDAARPLGVFTGGSLLAGAAARTDLVDPERSEELARAQYASLRRLLDLLPDEAAVWPTHGAGSFCSAPQRGERTTTIGRERSGNPLLAAGGEEGFVAALLAGLGSYPSYFRRLAEVNRRGPGLRARPTLAPLTPEQVRTRLADGAQPVDVRPAADFAAGHVPGSLSIALREAFATWLGWLVEPDVPLVVVRDPAQDPAEVAWQALKVGHERLAGELAGGVDAWAAAGYPLVRIPRVAASATDAATVLDVRQDAEYAAGHLPGAVHVELGELAARAGDVPPGPVVVMCGHGERATTGASLLARIGRANLAVLPGGPRDWAAATGRSLLVGE